MFAKRYPPEELIEIIAAQSYSPEIVSYVKKVDHHPTLGKYLAAKPKLGVTGTIAKDYVDATTPHAIPYISTKQVKGLHAYIEDAKYISKEADIKWKKCRVDDGDIVINKSGDVGAAAVLCCQPYKYANSVSDIISIKLSKPASIDRDFLVVYLNSPFGQKQLQRLSGGAIFSHVSLHAIPHINVFTANAQAQKYIGDKVRQAERLRTWAKVIEAGVNEYHQALIPSQAGLDFSKRVRIVSPARMSERLDAHFYPGVVDEYLRQNQGNFKALGKLCTSIYNGQTQPKTDQANLCKQITVTNLSSSFLGGTPRDVMTPGKKDKFLKPYDILMCNAAHNKSYIGKDLTYVHLDAPILPSTEVMTIRVDRNQLPASYVRSYLLSKLGNVQIQSTIRGITAHSYPGDMALLDIYIPTVSDSDRETWFACDDKLALAGKACEAATKLTSAAKFFVETLIEGQIEENLMIAAHEGLQSGNDSLDRDILSRLKANGMDGNGQLLFADLDELYRLLALAAED
jgi:type I restriction enzyme, S subunit